MPDIFDELDDDTKPDTEEEIIDVKPGPGKTSRKLAAFWLDAVNQYYASRKTYFKRGDDVIKRYRDERGQAAETGQRRMNILWANTKIMLPALYSSTPIPIIDRKFMDKDDLARMSSMVAERVVRNEITDNGYHRALKAAVLDYLLPGCGQVWVRYDSDVSTSISLPTAMHTSMEDDLAKIETGQEFKSDSETNFDTKDDEHEDSIEDSGSQLLKESVPVDYIDWHDFIVLPAKARTWQEVQAVGKRVMISRKEAQERFGKEISSELHPENLPQSSKNELQQTSDSGYFSDTNDRSIVIYEIWNKTDLRVYWVSPNYEYLCDIREDPLKLSGFFPCPPPLFSTLTNDSLVPVSDYWEYQDQAIQIDELTQRIAMLTKACKVAGTYDAQNTALKRLLDEDMENMLVPVDNWAVHAEKGGVAGGVSFLPLKDIQSVIATLQEARQTCMQDLDLVTGINDVMRGTTDSRETLGGIRLKNNNTGTRLSERQNEVARFARDVVRIMTEIICKHCSDEMLIESSGILYEDECDVNSLTQQLVMEAVTNQVNAQRTMGPPQQPQGNVVPFPGAQQPPQMQPPQMQPPQQSAPINIQMLYVTQKSQAEEIITNKVAAAIMLLRKDIDRRYRIDIEVDSTVYPDIAQERENVKDFFDSFATMMKVATEISMTTPEAIPLMGKALQWGVRKYRSGRDLESSIEDFCNKMAKKAAYMLANPQQSPEQIKAESEKAKSQAEIQKIQMQNQAQAENDARDMQRQQAEDQREMQKEAQEQQSRVLEHRLDAEVIRLQAEIKKRELNMQLVHMQREEEFKQAEHERKMEELKLKQKTSEEIAKKKIAAAGQQKKKKSNTNGKK